MGDGPQASESREYTKHYPDLQDHIAKLENAQLVQTIDAPVNKDTELHPLVRWQFRGGIPEADRKAFKFTNVTDSRGRTFDMPVIVGALASNTEIYSIGMGVPVGDIGEHWNKAIANPITPITVDNAPCQEVVEMGEAWNVLESFRVERNFAKIYPPFE